MENRIQELTNKLLTEGVEKGKAEADRIISEANSQSSAIIDSAKKEAEEIIETAKKKAQALNDNTKSELQMFANQSLNAIKTEIANVLCDNSLNESISSVTLNKDFMNEFILKMAEKWSSQENIVISTEDAASLKAFFASKAKALLDKGVKIEEVHGQKALFSISPENGAYRVNFGEEEFVSFFKSFLRPQLVEMLFK